MKSIVEWCENGCMWKQSKVDVSSTKNGRLKFYHDGALYVMNDNKIGTEVLKLEGKTWMPCGRVARGSIFLGLEGETYSEFNERQFHENPVQRWERPVMQ